MKKIHLEILNPRQKKLLAKLSFLSKDYYLAGGTSLSLYFGHRSSLDFDFYTGKNSQSSKFLYFAKRSFPILILIWPYAP